MANTITEVLPKLLAQGLMALRQNAVMPRLVNRAYESLAGEKGSTITIPIPSAITAQDVAPANTPPSTADVAPTSVTIALNKWKEAPFYLTDKDMLEVMNGTIPMQASEAVKAVCNQVEADLFSLYTQVYGYAGTAGTTPFASDLTAFTAARGVLNKQLAPKDPRSVVLDVDAETNAINLPAFQYAAYRGDTEGITEGTIGRKLGSLWTADQNVVTHTTGAAASYQTNGAATAGATSVTIDTGTGAFVAGDIVTFTGHTQTYAVQSSVGGATATSITVSPALKVNVGDNVAITKKASHVVNLAFHRDAIALVSRPFSGADPLGIGHYLSAIDEVSGLALRLEVSREHKRTRFSYDCLYGCQLVRPEFIARIAG